MGNIQGGWQFVGHFICYFMSQILESLKQDHIKQINPKFATKSEFCHVCVFRCAYARFRHLI